MADTQKSRYLRLTQEINDPNLTCYVCLQMRARKPGWTQQGGTEVCLLCNNAYCDLHKSKTVPNTCEINHLTYCAKANHKARHNPIQIFKTMAEREVWIAQNGSERAAGSSQSCAGAEERVSTAEK